MSLGPFFICYPISQMLNLLESLIFFFFLLSFIFMFFFILSKRLLEVYFFNFMLNFLYYYFQGHFVLLPKLKKKKKKTCILQCLFLSLRILIVLKISFSSKDHCVYFQQVQVSFFRICLMIQLYLQTKQWKAVESSQYI